MRAAPKSRQIDPRRLGRRLRRAIFPPRLRVDGDEKFLPANRTSQFGLFALQTLDRGAFKAEGGPALRA